MARVVETKRQESPFKSVRVQYDEPQQDGKLYEQTITQLSAEEAAEYGGGVIAGDVMFTGEMDDGGPWLEIHSPGSARALLLGLKTYFGEVDG